MTHEYEGYVLKIDKRQNLLHMRSNFNGDFIDKTYPFSAVRKWNYNLQKDTPTQVIGTGTGAAIANVVYSSKIKKENLVSTGLFVYVKDAQYPKWRIAFFYDIKHPEITELELQQWIELLNQCMNGSDEIHYNANEIPERKMTDDIHKCPTCGTENTSDAAFCRSCGGKMDKAQSTTACANCGNRLQEGADYCSLCGEKVSQNSN